MDPSGRDSGLVFLFLSQLSQSLSRLPEDVPSHIYHYTIAPGFAGIAKEKVIRATNFSFLNDPSEIQYGLELTIAVLRYLRESASADRRPILDHCMSAMEAKAWWEVYVACFSELPDDISQWRAYGGAARERYCLGFETEKLSALFNSRPTTRLTKISYRKEQQIERIQAFAERSIAFVEKNAIDPANWPEVGQVVANIMAWVLPEMKRPSYTCEAEWRVICRAESPDAEVPDVDVSRGVLRPFVPLQLAGSLPLTSVRILAPSRKQAAKKASEILLQHAGLGGVEVTESMVPFVD